jgi:hypothetical protein
MQAVHFGLEPAVQPPHHKSPVAAWQVLRFTFVLRPCTPPASPGGSYWLQGHSMDVTE